MLIDLLRGYEAGMPQAVGNMVHIPLIPQTQSFEEVGSADDLRLEGDPDYGTLVIGTDSPHVTIVPQGYTYVTKERAQDRTIPSAALIKGGGQNVHAFCVQSSQAGHMTPGEVEGRQIRLLPMSLRNAAYFKRQESEVGAIWGDIRKFNERLGVSGDYLVTFFNDYQVQLEQFVAQFERVPGQRGALVMINDEVVGIEVLPNDRAMGSVWTNMIRDCYGSEALFRQAGSDTPEPGPMEDVETLEELLDAVERQSAREQEWAEKVVSKTLEQDLTTSQEAKEGQFILQSVETKDFTGQMVTYEGHVIYLSILRREVQQRAFRFRSRPS